MATDELHALRSTLHPRPAHVHRRELLPALLVVVIALTGAQARSSPPVESCESTDGPQFACWLDRAQRAPDGARGALTSF